MTKFTPDSRFVVAILLAIALALLHRQGVLLTTSLYMYPQPPTCEVPAYKARILSYDPMIVHLENFISRSERESIITYGVGRTSTSALLSTNISSVSCVAERFLEFQGFQSFEQLEGIQMTHYDETQQFRKHYDFRPNATNIEKERFKRATTGFAILQANCTSCGTQFPLLRMDFTNASQDWCRVVDCEETKLTVKPLPGSLLFWQNVRSDGFVDDRMLHAGLPLSNGGSKTGMNIWTKIDLWNSVVQYGNRSTQ